MHINVCRVQPPISAVLATIVRCVRSNGSFWCSRALLGHLGGHCTAINGLVWGLILQTTNIIECTVLRSTFVLQTQLLLDKIGPQMLPDAAISTQLDPWILPTSLPYTDDNIYAVQYPAKLVSYFNEIVPDRAAPH